MKPFNYTAIEQPPKPMHILESFYSEKFSEKREKVIVFLF